MRAFLVGALLTVVDAAAAAARGSIRRGCSALGGHDDVLDFTGGGVRTCCVTCGYMSPGLRTAEGVAVMPTMAGTVSPAAPDPMTEQAWLEFFVVAGRASLRIHSRGATDHTPRLATVHLDAQQLRQMSVTAYRCLIAIEEAGETGTLATWLATHYELPADQAAQLAESVVGGVVLAKSAVRVATA